MQSDESLIYQSKTWIAANKKAGQSVIPDKTGDQSLMASQEEALAIKLYPVHRIDRPVSGIVIYATTKKTAGFFSQDLKSRIVKRIYLAAVSPKPDKDHFRLDGWITNDGKKNKSSFSLKEADSDSKRATADFYCVDSIDNYHLLAVSLDSGRHHQIRAMLAHLGCPAKGDIKYGARRKNRDRSIHLHSWKMVLNDPDKGEEKRILTAPIPNEVVWKAFDLAKAEELLKEEAWLGSV